MASVYSRVTLPNERSIRILTLQPGQPGDTLVGTLTPEDIDNIQDYEPLSYVWGDPTRTHTMNCGKSAVELTGSLCDALQRLRFRQGSRRLWVDQICINQQNKEERSQQVQFMNAIYKKAARVLVWLGPDDDSLAQHAFQLVQALADIFQNSQSRANFDLDHLENLSTRSSVDWNPLKALVKRVWFTRTWIVQEIGTQAPATLFWGDAEIDWAIVHTVCEELTAYHQLRKVFDINTAEIKYIYQRFIEPKRTSRHANRFSFIYELHRARHLKVTDPRDRIYAFLGHYSVRESQNEALRSLTADYTKKTVEDVYIDVASRALQDASEPLIALAAVQHMSLPSRSELDNLTEHNLDLPSWVPDWRTYQSHILSEPTSPHTASGTHKAMLRVDENSRVLSIRGIEIDKIGACSTELKSREFHISGAAEENDPPTPAIERIWREVLKEDLPIDLDRPYINGDPAVLAFTQTISNGCVAIWWQQQGELPEADRRPYREIPTSEWLTHGAGYLAQALPPVKLSAGLLDRVTQGKSNAHRWSRAANGASTNRVFARTEKGYFVLGPRMMAEGDVIVVLFGGKMPFCLRPWGEQYLMVGECYVHGVMRGEMLEKLGSGEVEQRMFEIV